MTDEPWQCAYPSLDIEDDLVRIEMAAKNLMLLACMNEIQDGMTGEALYLLAAIILEKTSEMKRKIFPQERTEVLS